MHLVICEDDASLSQQLHGMIERWAALHDTRVDIDTFPSAEAFLVHWPPADAYDMIFLDIMMGRMTGMELAQAIRKTDSAVLLTFISALREYTTEGYKVSALRYLLKPLQASECYDALDAAAALLRLQRENTVIVPTRDGVARVSALEVTHFTSEGHEVYVHLDSKKPPLHYRGRISAVLDSLPAGMFCQIHKTIIINLFHIHTIRRDSVTLDNGTCLRVAAARWADLNRAFLAFHSR